MNKLRKGDTVLIRARVTDVAEYDENLGQQIQVKCLPKGTSIGWMVPTEYTFSLERPEIHVGDRVWLDRAQSLVGEVIAIRPEELMSEGGVLSEEVAWVKPTGRSDYRTIPTKELDRA